MSTTVRKTYFLRNPLRVFNVSPYVQKYVNVNAALKIQFNNNIKIEVNKSTQSSTHACMIHNIIYFKCS